MTGYERDGEVFGTCPFCHGAGRDAPHGGCGHCYDGRMFQDDLVDLLARVCEPLPLHGARCQPADGGKVAAAEKAWCDSFDDPDPPF